MIKDDRGFTLVELLASIVILGLVVSLFLNISSDSLRSNKSSDRSTAAIQLAGQVMNDLRTYLNNQQDDNQGKPLSQDDLEADIDKYIDENYPGKKINQIFKVDSGHSLLTSPTPLNNTMYGNHNVSVQTFFTVSSGGKLQDEIITVAVYWGDT